MDTVGPSDSALPKVPARPGRSPRGTGPTDPGGGTRRADTHPELGPNELRASWLNATTLTTALSLGIMAYVLSAFAVVIGLTVFALGFGFLRLRKAQVAVH